MASNDPSDAARRWIAGDPDPDTRRELQALLDAGDRDALAARVDGTLEFGTAGLRGVVGAGPLRMNRAVVIRTTRGLADHVLAGADGRRPLVVLGFDARRDSHRFAQDAIGVLAAAGIEVRYFPEPIPTPVVAFAARHLSADAAVVVTASHNPPEYNGYKVYARGGVQIVPPTDREIAQAIAAVGPAAEVPRVEEAFGADGVESLGEELLAAYLSGIQGLRPEGERRPQRLVYTPLHGVGWRTVQRALVEAGHTDLHVVGAQAEPDGEFPTVAFPNPEEAGALDLAMSRADEVGAQLILANDPDADRLAVAIPDGDGWQALSGNQIGVLLGAHLLERYQGDRQPLVVSSIVSSPMLAGIADAVGAHHEATLTGFKWICTAAVELERTRDLGFVLGYEEALGYSVGDLVRDKDGISAAVVFADLACQLAAEGRTIADRLEELYRRYGLWVSEQISVVRQGREGQERIAAAMERAGHELPEALAGRAVVGATDFREGAGERPRWLGATPLVALALEDGSRVLVRPSGTEPKLKVYADLRADAPEGDLDAAFDRLQDDAARAGEELMAHLRV